MKLMENSDIITQDFYALIEACDKYLPYKSRNLRPGEPPVIEEPKPEPPKPLLLAPPKKQYNRTDSFRVRFLTDPETGYRLITSRRLRIWLFGDSARFEYGEDGTCVFAQ